MKKLFIALAIIYGLIGTPVFAVISTGDWILDWLQGIRMRYGCELICQNPAICIPGTSVWISLEPNSDECRAEAASASMNMVHFGILDLSYSEIHLAYCQGG